MSDFSDRWTTLGVTMPPPDWRDPASWDDRVDRTIVPASELSESVPGARDFEFARSTLRKTLGAATSPSVVSSSVPTIGVGTRLKERFVLEQLLGVGGMGSVFKARDIRREEARDAEPYVAIKILNDEFRRHPDSLISLQRETRRTQKLAHPNIVRVFDFDRDGATVYMSMELLEGQSLSTVIRSRPEGMAFGEAWPIIRGVGQALEYAHANHVVHADVKPSNVFITSSNQVKVFDFSIASAIRFADDALATTTLFDPQALGALTPAYASPERLQGLAPRPLDDIFSFALVIYELLAGRRPYHTVKSALENRQEPHRLIGLSRGQWRVLRSALALERSDRPSNIESMLKGLSPRPWYRQWL
jgi:non-specific serine/threonine protein kinase